MAWGVYDQQSWDLHLDVQDFRVQLGYLLLELFPWEERGTDLLGYSALFSVLDFGFSDMVQDFCFASIHVAHDADDRTS